jgi:hypothetical protein
MKLNELNESYMSGLYIPLPAIVRTKGVAALLKELSGEKGMVKELPLKQSLYFLYTGKKPTRNEVATLLQDRFNISFEQAMKYIPE